MTSQTFVNKQGHVDADWLNDVNDVVYNEPGNLLTGASRAGQIGFDASLTYPAGTVGAALKGGTVSFIDIKGAGVDPTGTTDSTAAIQAKFDQAAATGGVVAVTAGTYLISQLYIPNGMKGLTGLGGTFLLDGSNNCGILVKGTIFGGATEVSGLTIQGIRIDAANATGPTVCLWAPNTYDCRYLDNVIVNVANGYGILCRNYTSAGAFGGGNIISRNKVFGTLKNSSSATATWYGIAVDSEPVYTTTPADPSIAPATDMWRKTFTAPSAVQPNGGNIISNNRVSGGYYGLMLHSLVDSVVSDNNISGCMRGMSLQNSAYRNNITGNTITECYSSSIHMAFGAYFNQVEGNNIYTSVGQGEALIQAYVGCAYNNIVGNRCHSADATGSQHGIYIAVMSNWNTVRGNSIAGNYRLAYIAVASAWSAASVYTYRYATGSDGSHTDWMANAPTDGNVIQANTIRRDTKTQPAIFLDQATTHASGTYTPPSGIQAVWDAAYTASYAAPVTNTVVEGNVVLGSSGSNNLYLLEDSAGNLNTVTLKDNTFSIPNVQTTPGTLGIYLVMPRGRAYFTQTSGNYPIDNNPFDIPIDIAQPYVPVGKYFLASALSAVSIDKFLFGMDGQEIVVRLNTVTGLVHGGVGTADTLVLANGQSILPGEASANSWISFRRQSTVWFETGRSVARVPTPVYVTGTSTSCASGGAYTKLAWPNVVTNVNAEWAGDTFTCKFSGVYQVDCALQFTGGVIYAIDEQTTVNVYINGNRVYAGHSTQSMYNDGSHGKNMTTMIAVSVPLTRGDTLEFYVFNNATGGAVAANGITQACWATITKVA